MTLFEILLLIALALLVIATPVTILQKLSSLSDQLYPPPRD